MLQSLRVLFIASSLRDLYYLEYKQQLRKESLGAVSWAAC